MEVVAAAWCRGEVGLAYGMLHPPTDTQALKKPIFVDVIEIEEHPPVVLMENRLRS